MKEEECDSTILLSTYKEKKTSVIQHLLINPISISVDYISNNPLFVSILKIEDFLIQFPKFEGNYYANIDEAINETWIF